VPYASDNTRGAPNGGAFEQEQPLLQGQPPPTPYAPGDDTWANVAIGGRALGTRITEAPGVGRDAQAQGAPWLDEPPTADCRGWDRRRREGPFRHGGSLRRLRRRISHGPEGRADHTELARARAEVERLRVALEMYRDRERVRTLGARFYDPNHEAKMPEMPKAIETARPRPRLRPRPPPPRRRRRAARGTPTQIPDTNLPAGESTSPARPSSKRLQARRGRVHRR